jgi:glycosyltransferase involved in cell wall biosynthesis
MKILFLSTWFPYPPDQGSKIRAYHILRALASRHELSVLSFKDSDLEQASIDHIEKLSSQVRVIDKEPFAQNLLGRSLGWFSTKPRAVVGNYSPRMAQEVAFQIDDWQPDAIFALTYIAAMYVPGDLSAFRIADVDNLLSLMLYEQFQAASNSAQMLRRYLAFRKFQRFERDLYKSFDLNLVTSERDARRIREYIPLTSRQVLTVPNGVDLSYFQPVSNGARPGAMVFNGALTYEPNYDAMNFFLTDIYPSIKRRVPAATLSITGSTENVDLKSLPMHPGVTCTGYVEDIRKVIRSSTACVVPLRMGAGTRLKILEALALGVPVVTTSKGAEGLSVETGKHLLIANSSADFVSATIKVLTDAALRRDLITNGLELVQRQYDWENIGTELVGTIESMINEGQHVA